MDETVRSLFWDAAEKEIDLDMHASYVIERILEHGNDVQVRWLFGRYPLETIQSVIEKNRGLSVRSRNYWGIKLKGWKPQQSAPPHSVIWKY